MTPSACHIPSFCVLAVLAISSVEARITPLAQVPDWTQLDKYQETITHAEFSDLLNRIYAPGGAASAVIGIEEDHARIVTREGKDPYFLRFAKDRVQAKAVPNFWRPKREIPTPTAEKPLAGLKIALDPGHLGGSWAKVEERWFRVGNSKPVTEGDMTLLVAKKLVPRLESLGAEVFLTRSKPGPVTSLRPETLKKEAKLSLADKERPLTPESLKSEAERLFYRVGEIRRRAKLVNDVIRPDLVLCLHFNAEAWGNENNPQLVDVNHLHFLVTGAWSAEELTYEDQRFDMLNKMLGRSFFEEVDVTESIAKTMARETGLPPYVYLQGNAVRVNDNPYIYARNLLANRLFLCPVVYVEPYVMNSKAAFARIQAGDYDGRRKFDGALRKSIYREYADSLVDGLVAYYSNR
ncbi:MAG: N-acetylmuramoyl-L-alanine amidase [Terrimicrobiaceae bacterium]